MLFVTVGTGIGGGLVLDGEIYRGPTGMGAELGHMTVDPLGPRCGCGKHGCLEAVASSMALARAVHDAVARKEPTVLATHDQEPIDTATIGAAASQGDGVALRILTQAAEHLGRGISFLLNVLNPEMIVLGGPVALAGEGFLREVRGAVARHALLPHGVAVVPSTLGDKAELTGAVLLAMERTVKSVRIVGG